MHHRLATILTLCASPCVAAAPTEGGVAGSQRAALPPGSEAAGSDAGAAAVTDDVDKQYAAAAERYAAGDLAGAIRVFEQCYTATQAENLLFNLAQLYRELGDCTKALEYYQLYIHKAPDGERSSDAKGHVEVLRPRCGTTPAPKLDPRPTPVPLAVTPAPPPPRTNYWQPVGWIALGASALATAATVFASIEANHAKRDVERMLQAESFAAGELMSRNDDFYHDRNWAFALGATAVVTAGFGVYALGVAAPRARAQDQAFSLLVLPNRAYVGYQLGF
jgi:tetratricopeptide (TPR) repeat protein